MMPQIFSVIRGEIYSGDLELMLKQTEMEFRQKEEPNLYSYFAYTNNPKPQLILAIKISTELDKPVKYNLALAVTSEDKQLANSTYTYISKIFGERRIIIPQADNKLIQFRMNRFFMQCRDGKGLDAIGPFNR